MVVVVEFELKNTENTEDKILEYLQAITISR